MKSLVTNLSTKNLKAQNLIRERERERERESKESHPKFKGVLSKESHPKFVPINNKFSENPSYDLAKNGMFYFKGGFVVLGNIS